MSEDESQAGTADDTSSNDENGRGRESAEQQPERRQRTRNAERQNSPQGDDDEQQSVDWKSESRKHEKRAKDSKAQADRVAAEKAAAEEARQQAEAKNQDLLDGIAKVLGLKSDDQPPDPAKLQQNLTELGSKVSGLEQTLQAKDDEIAGRDRTIASKDVELAAWRIAVRNGIDAVTLMDLRSTERRLADLDPAADDFVKQLEATVKDIAKDNPALRTSRDVTASEAGIGSSGSRDAAATATPGAGRLRAAYSSS